MADKSLKSKAIKIKGKDYVLVADRVVYFNNTYQNGAIEPSYKLIDDTFYFKAIVTPDVANPARCFIAHSQATIGDGMVNKTAAMENAETSAVGRALAMMGIGVLESIASADEMNKAAGSSGNRPVKFATQKQIDWVRSVASRISGFSQEEDIDAWVKDALTVEPKHIPLTKVKSAVDKLLEIEKTWQDTERKEVSKDIVAEVTDDDLKALEEGRLPY